MEPSVVIRTRARSTSVWRQIEDNTPDLTPYEQKMIDFALGRINDFPRGEFEVRRIIEANVNINGQTNVPVNLAKQAGYAPVSPPFSEDEIDVESILRSKGASANDLSWLTQLQAPAKYNPCPTVEQLKASFEKNNYFLNDDDIFGIHQALLMGRAIKVDGPPGTGKSELAKQIAIAMGLDVKNSFQFGQLFCTPDSIESMESKAIYSWNDAKRLIDMQLIASLSSRVNGEQLKEMYAKVSANSFGEQYLNIQVLLRACCIPYRTVCLVDEVDKTYHEFDNILLDIIDKNQFVIPEFGPVGRTEFNPQTSPIFVLTSNASRDLSGPLARRCNAVFYDYLPENLEAKVVKEKAGLPEEEAGLIAHFFKMMRTHNSMHLQQPPSTAEVIQTAKALKLTGLEVVETNLLKLHSHWIKCRMDYDSLCSCYKNINNSGEWSM